MKKLIKKAISLILCMLVVLSSVSSAVAGEAKYPKGVSSEDALNAVDGTERLLGYLLPLFLKTDFKSLIGDTLYTDKALTDIMVGIYSSFEENGDTMKLMGLDVSTGGMSNVLENYPSVSKELANASSWAEINADKMKWGVTDKISFSDALAAIFSPLNDILYTLLCNGEYKMNPLITIQGGAGYTNAIIPLYKSLFVKEYMSQDEFTASANENKNNMVKNIVLPIFTWFENMTKTPVNTLTESLPSFAYYVDSGKFNENLQSLLDPIKNNKLVELAVTLKLFDMESLNFEIDISSLMNSLTQESGLKIKEIDFSRLASCGKPESDGYKSDKGLAYVEIMRWLIDTVKLNKESMNKLIGENDDLKFLEELLNKDTDSLLVTIIGLFKKGEVDKADAMVYPAFTSGTVEYTENLNADRINKVYNEIDDLLDQFVKEGGNASSMEQLIKGSLYTGSNINALIKGVYGALEENGLLPVMQMIGVDCSPKGVANLLTENKYSSAKNAFSSATSWKKVSFKNVKWGFYNGSRNGFQNALTAVLRPLFPVLRVLLAQEDLVLFDSIYITGTDGYNTSIIPVLEALGCKDGSIKSYKQYKRSSDGDGVIKNILNPVFDLLDDLAEKPVKTAVKILPNIIYFMDSGSLDVCVSNLLLPITSFLNRADLGLEMPMDAGALTKELDINNIAKTLLSDSGMKVADFDVKKIASLGVKTEKKSKSVIDGKNVSYSYIEADTSGVVMALLRVVAKTMQMPGNETLLMGTMGGNNVAFDVSAISQQFEGMTENQFIEWLVNLFFKERVKVEIIEEEEYSPTIIFTPEEENHTVLYVFIAYVCLCVVVGIVIFINRKRLYGNTEVD